MLRYAVRHVTTYAYTEAVSLCQNLAHLSVRAGGGQTADPSRLVIVPEPAVVDERLDYFGNPTHHFTIQEPHRELTLTATHRVTVTPPAAVSDTPAWESVRDALGRDLTPDWLDAYQFTFDSRFVAADPAYAGYARESFPAARPVLDAARDLMHRVHADFVYDPQSTTVATPLADVFANRRGVCQDFAHVLLACFRSLGLAARYVSGYLSTTPPPGRPRLLGADATHAWVSLFCGEAGWVDLDPTNDQVTQDRHILLAWGRDYDDVSPLKGVILGGGQHTVTVAVDVKEEV